MKILLRLLFSVAIVYFLFGILIFVFQRKFIYYPTAQDFNSCENFARVEKVTYKGTRMYVHKSADRWVVIYHGNAGSACDRLYLTNHINPKEYSYIVVEYAGYSSDSQSPSQNALMGNVKAVVEYLQQQKPSEVLVIGESLGTALAAYHSSLSQSNKLLLIAPFDSIANLAQHHYWFYPVKFFIRDKFPANEWAKNLDNVHIIHGIHDSIIPISFGKKLSEAILGTNKTFVEVPGAGHNDIFDFPLTQEKIKAFFK